MSKICDKTLIKPCPFCGSEAKIVKIGHREYRPGFIIKCTAMTCRTQTAEMQSVAEALIRWNRRAKPKGGLIDREKLLEELRDFKDWETEDGRPMHTWSERQRIDKCIDIVKSQHIYVEVESKDKIVDKLLELKDTPRDDSAEERRSVRTWNLLLEKAIAIVKGEE